MITLCAFYGFVSLFSYFQKYRLRFIKFPCIFIWPHINHRVPCKHLSPFDFWKKALKIVNLKESRSPRIFLHKFLGEREFVVEIGLIFHLRVFENCVEDVHSKPIDVQEDNGLSVLWNNIDKYVWEEIFLFW